MIGGRPAAIVRRGIWVNWQAIKAAVFLHLNLRTTGSETWKHKPLFRVIGGSRCSLGLMALLRRKGLVVCIDGGNGDRMRIEELRNWYSLVCTL